MRQFISIGELMKRIPSLGKRQHYVDMGDFKVAYEVVGELK